MESSESARFAEAFHLQQARRYAEAAAIYAALAKTHLTVNVAQNLGLCLEALGEYPQAEHWLLVAVRHRPDDPVLKRLLGSVLAAQGRLGEAEQAFRAVLALHPADTGATLGLAALLLSSAVAGSAPAQAPAPVPAPVQPGTPGAPAPAPAPVVPAPVTPAPVLPAAPPVERPAGVAATVNGQQIPEVNVFRALRQFPPEEHALARKEILNHLVENTLIDQYLTALKTEVAPAEVDKLLEELKAELKRSNKDYPKELEQMMLTEAEFRVEVTAQMKWDKFLKQQGTDAALVAFFEKRPDLFDGTLVRARHILITPGADAAKVAEAKKKLADIKATVAAEGDKAVAAAAGDALAKEQARGKRVEELFAQFAKDHSTCPSNKNGGDLQFFPRVGAMVEPFAEAAFKLNVHQMSEVVETEFGQHLIMAVAKTPGKARKFEEVKEDVRVVYAMQLRAAVVGQMKPKAQIAITPVTTPTAVAPVTATPPGSPMK